jgi:hypothetical protein
VRLVHLSMWLLFRCAAPIWGTFPLLALLAFLPWFPKDLISFDVWRALAVTWAVSFLATFCLLLWLAERSHNAKELVSVLCTISFGLPAIALGALPAVGPPGLVRPPHSEETVSLKDLPPARENGALPLAYIVGLDVSRSFSPGKDDQVRAILLRLFGDHGTVGAAMHPDDQYFVYAFSQGTPELLMSGKESADLIGKGRRDLLRRLDTRTLAKKRTALDVNKTDVLGFITAVCGNLQGGAQFGGVRLLLRSDFLQSPPLEGQPLNDQLGKLLSASSNIPNFSIVAFRSPPASPESNGTDVLRPLREALGPVRVQEIDLDRYSSTADEAEQVALPSGLIGSTAALRSCDLVPPALDGSGPSRVLLDIPKTPEFDEIYFGLYADDSGAAPLRVRIPDCDGAVGGMRTLDPEPGSARFCKLRPRLRPSPMVIEVDSRSRFAADARGSLKISIPQRNQMGTIDLSVARFGNLAVFRSLLIVLAILNLVPFALSLMLFSHAKRPEGGPASGAPRLPAP